MFFSVVLVGLILILCGDNWFVIWLGFELTLMGFLPIFSGGSLMIEGLIKYFLVQAGGSGLFALSFLLPFSLFTNSLFVLGIFIKLGVFPFYRWVPLVIRSLTWEGCLILVTIQKVGPLFVVCSQSFSRFSFLLLFGVFTILIGGLLGYNQSYMRSLMAYSSIRHTGWLVIGFICSFSIFLLYLCVYFLLLGVLFGLFSFLKFNKVITRGVGLKSWGFVNLFILSLSGIPPFSMFFLKMSILYCMANFYFFVPFILFGAVLSIYYYLTFVIPSLSFFWCNYGMDIGGRFGVLGVLFRLVLPILFFF